MSEIKSVTESLRTAVDAGDLGAIAEAVSALETHNDAEANPRQAYHLTLDEFGVDELTLDEKWTHVTWITCPDRIGHEVWVGSEKGYLVFSIMPQNSPSVAIWLDDKSAEELAAKLHTNCAGWDAGYLGSELQAFVVVDQEDRIRSVEDLLTSDDPGHRAWAERIPALSGQVDERMRRKGDAASLRASGQEPTDELLAELEERRKVWWQEFSATQQC